MLHPAENVGLDRAKAPGLRLSERGVVLRQYIPPLRQLNRGSFRVGPTPHFRLDGALALSDFAVFDAVGEVDDKANGKPKEHLDPGSGGEDEHLGQAGGDAEERHPGDKGDFERTLKLGMGVAENPDAQADNRKDKEGDHRDKLAQNLNGKEPREGRGDQGRCDGSGDRGPQFAVDFSKGFGKEPIFADGEEDAGLAKELDKDDR